MEGNGQVGPSVRDGGALMGGGGLDKDTFRQTESKLCVFWGFCGAPVRKITKDPFTVGGGGREHLVPGS